MFYRFALGVGLLLLGAFIGRELSQTRPARKMLRAQRNPVVALRPVTSPTRKISIH